jgi:DNA-binding SARP family transcriptional activator
MDPYIDKIHFYMGSAYMKNGKRDQACQEFYNSVEEREGMLTEDLEEYCR